MKEKVGCLYDIIGGIVFLFIISLFITPIRNWEFNTVKSFIYAEEKAAENDSIKSDSVKVDTVFQRIEVETKHIKGDTIQLFQNENGKGVNVKANLCGIPMIFCLDTGCSDVSLSPLEYMFFKKHGFIKSKSEKEGICTLADGTKHDVTLFTLDYLVLGKDTIRNVECSVMNDDTLSSSSILLGQGALDRFGDIIISYKNKQLIILKD